MKAASQQLPRTGRNPYDKLLDHVGPGYQPETSESVMMKHSPRALTRRQLLLASLAGAAGAFLGPVACASRIEGPCGLTPPQTEGPFYPIDDQLDEDSDLTFVSGRAGRAEGRLIYVRGQLRDSQCRPIPGARVEIWQASAKGRYNHPYDRENPVPLDPNFQGWGEALSDKDGRYLFKTVHPGQYPAGPGWIRPSHIHFKVLQGELELLTTQMYFAGDEYLERDRIFLGVPVAERERVIVRPEEPGTGLPPDAVIYRFDLAIG